MSLEDEKKLVAENLMGWTLEKQANFNDYNVLEINMFSLGEWGPQDNEKATCKEWDEIFEAMDGEVWMKYMDIIVDENNIWNEERFIHTVKPAIKWQALLKTLKEMK